MKTEIISVSLPTGLSKELNEAKNREDRTKSSIIRRALIDYLDRDVEEVLLEGGDAKAIEEAERDFKEGSIKSLEQKLNEVQNRSIEKSRKTNRRS